LTDLTRRNILTGAAVTAAGAVASTNLVTPAAAATPAPAAPSTANAKPPAPAAATPAPFPELDPKELQLFVTLSSGLTGISPAKLAPTVDPIQIKRDYFNAAKFIEKPSRTPNPNFPKLMDIMRAETDPVVAAAKVMNNPDPAIMYLGRSIILAWYLGVWYDPDVLKRYTAPNQPRPVPVDRVISPAAYTQGWTWRVAQAHPMGYSELRYGYWAQDAQPLSDYIA